MDSTWGQQQQQQQQQQQHTAPTAATAAAMPNDISTLKSWKVHFKNRHH
jgi:hypothetical protein